MKQDIHQQARGKWRGILATLGLPAESLKDKHGPCPMCGGTDRFRWDNKDGSGSFVCGQCGAGNGVDFVMKFKGVEFKEAASQVRDVLGVAPLEPIKPDMTEEKRRHLLRELWRASGPIRTGDPVDRYLTARGVGETEPHYSPALMTCQSCYFSQGVNYPAMVGVVSDVVGKPVSLHRTYILDGDKAPVDEPRRIMPGKVPEGACIRIGDVQEEIGIAEGIETAMAASHMYELPVWSAINSSMLKNWIAPEGVKSVVIFADNDQKFGGQAAAYHLAHKLSVKGLDVSVHVPDFAGKDFNDVLNGRRNAA